MSQKVAKKRCLRSGGFVRKTDEPAAGSLKRVISHTLNDRRNQLKIEYVHPARYCIGAGRKIALSISITNRYPDSPTSRGKVVSCGIPEPCPLVGMPCRQGISPKWWIPTLIRQTSLYTVFLRKVFPHLWRKSRSMGFWERHGDRPEENRSPLLGNRRRLERRGRVSQIRAGYSLSGNGSAACC